MPEAVILATARPPIGRAFKGPLKDMSPDDLSAQTVRSALDRVPALDSEDIVDLMLGRVQPAVKSGFNLGRIVSVLLGMDHLRGTAVNRYCSSSLRTARMAIHAIRTSESTVLISAGVELVSRFTKGNYDAVPDTENREFDAAKSRPATCAAGGQTWRHARAEQDEFGVCSQSLAGQAIPGAFWECDITPVILPDGSVVTHDDGPRAGVKLEAVPQLQPGFQPHGTVTTADRCPLNGGAAAVIVVSHAKAKRFGLTPLARVVSTASVYCKTAATPPSRSTLAPQVAVNRVTSRRRPLGLGQQFG